MGIGTKCLGLHPSQPSSQLLRRTTDSGTIVAGYPTRMQRRHCHPKFAVDFFTGNAKVVIFETGGHRMENTEEMLAEIEKAISSY